MKLCVGDFQKLLELRYQQLLSEALAVSNLCANVRSFHLPLLSHTPGRGVHGEVMLSRAPARSGARRVLGTGSLLCWPSQQLTPGSAVSGSSYSWPRTVVEFTETLGKLSPGRKVELDFCLVLACTWRVEA